MLVKLISLRHRPRLSIVALTPAPSRVDWTPVPFSRISDVLERFSVLCPSPEPVTNWDKLHA
jgi:hypothetical protein